MQGELPSCQEFGGSHGKFIKIQIKTTDFNGKPHDQEAIEGQLIAT
jgi:hypothetical protein